MPTGVQEPKLWRFADFLSNSLVVPCSLGSPLNHYAWETRMHTTQIYPRYTNCNQHNIYLFQTTLCSPCGSFLSRIRMLKYCTCGEDLQCVTNNKNIVDIIELFCARNVNYLREITKQFGIVKEFSGRNIVIAKVQGISSISN